MGAIYAKAYADITVASSSHSNTEINNAYATSSPVDITDGIIRISRGFLFQRQFQICVLRSNFSVIRLGGKKSLGVVPTHKHTEYSISNRLLAVWPITKGLFFECSVPLFLYLLGPWLSCHFHSLLGHSPMHRVNVSSTRNQSWKTDERQTDTQRKKSINQSCTTHVQTHEQPKHCTVAASRCLA